MAFVEVKSRRTHITLIGDVPIYVDHHSADVWAHPELFRLDESNQPIAVVRRSLMLLVK